MWIEPSIKFYTSLLVSNETYMLVLRTISCTIIHLSDHSEHTSFSVASQKSPLKSYTVSTTVIVDNMIILVAENLWADNYLN